MTEQFDAIVVGAGHNGLTCAAMLAKAGREVLVLEARDQVGGGAVTEIFADRYKVSSVAHLLYGLQPEVVRELDLKIDMAADHMTSIGLAEDGQHVRLRGDEVQGVDEADQRALREFSQRMRRFAELLNRQLLKPPPRLGTRRRSDLLALAGLGLGMRRLGRAGMREFLRVIGMNIYDELEECFDNPLLKGLLSVDAVLGTHLGPRSPNTVLTYLYRMAATGGRISSPRGGMGAVSAALARCASDRGVRIHTSSVVERIVVENGRAVGVETANGERFESLTIISNLDPRRTILGLLGSRHVETGFTKRISNIRTRGDAAKLHLALNKLPDIAGFTERDYGERLVIAPDADYVERAFNPAKYGQYSPSPVIEISFPSVHDATLAPQGGHVLSAVVQYAPHSLDGGWTDPQRAAFEQTVLATLVRYMPGIDTDLLAIELLTPADIEACFGNSGGHWHHGELTLDQFMFVRPVSGAAQYAMPLEGLYLCGAGAHPGGNVSGAAGFNAAREILRREKGA